MMEQSQNLLFSRVLRCFLINKNFELIIFAFSFLSIFISLFAVSELQSVSKSTQKPTFIQIINFTIWCFQESYKLKIKKCVWQSILEPSKIPRTAVLSSFFRHFLNVNETPPTEFSYVFPRGLLSRELLEKGTLNIGIRTYSSDERHISIQKTTTLNLSSRVSTNKWWWQRQCPKNCPVLPLASSVYSSVNTCFAPSPRNHPEERFSFNAQHYHSLKLWFADV